MMTTTTNPKKMTTKRRRPSVSHTVLKATLVVGTVLATWLGVNWAATHDIEQAAFEAQQQAALEAQQQAENRQPITSSRSSR